MNVAAVHRRQELNSQAILKFGILRVETEVIGYGAGQECYLEVNGAEGAWRECDYNRQEETGPGGRQRAGESIDVRCKQRSFSTKPSGVS